MKIAIGADHAGFDLKNHLAECLKTWGHEVSDLGAHSEQSVDYPDFAGHVARAVAAGKSELGVLVCGSGIGIGIAANKVDGIRAATCNDIFTATMSRRHNDANVVALGSRVVGVGVAEEIVRAFVDSDFDGGRHAQRIGKIHDLER